jgi:CHASE2 domain-containing sensor protein
MLLSAISVPALGLAGFLGLFISPKWRTAAITALAVAAGLAVLAVTTLVLFLLKVHASVYFTGILGIPLVTYAWVHRLMTKKFQVNPSVQATGLALGLFPLAIIGVYFWLLVGCSVAKECL